MTAIKANLVSKESLTPYVFKVLLETQEAITFKAGQYLQVVMAEQDKRPFSIASIPANSKLIELHIGAAPENPYAYEVIQKLEQDQSLMIEVAHGSAYLQSSELEAILLAGGTGYSYTKSLLMEILASQPQRKVSLYWGSKTFDDLYEATALTHLSEQHPQFTFVPVVEKANGNFAGKTGLVHRVLMSEVTDFSDKQVYVAGRFEMAKAVKDDLLNVGLKSENLIGDAFAFI
ncbi:NAD(P)H-flavin reductase [Ningiella sp. W23]|uniref:NAD(P)H-flavin reductase n=1 Tax=Ningiella sp. W23 TaxID=3023715 RepID=UPI0037583C44